MNLLLLEPEELDADGLARLEGRRARHVNEVLKKIAGDPIRIGVLGGRIGHAVLEHVSADAVVLRCVLEREPPPKRAVTLVLALPRPPVLRRILAHTTAIGVRRVVLLHSARVEKSYWGSPSASPEGIEAQLRLGLEQAVDTVAPEVRLARGFRRFVEHELAGLEPRVLVAHPGAERPCPCDPGEPLSLVIGPEGGWIPEEVRAFEDVGGRLVHLGSRVLRVETAVVGALVRLGL